MGYVSGTLLGVAGVVVIMFLAWVVWEFIIDPFIERLCKNTFFGGEGQ